MTRDSGSQVYTSGQSIRERVGLIVDGSNAEVAVKTIVAAEDAGVRQIWMSQPPVWPDVLTTFAAAATKTSTVRFGTSIVPTYPRHPLVLAQQALALYDSRTWSVAPWNRFQLPLYHRGHVRLTTENTVSSSSGIRRNIACCTLGREGRSSRRLL